MRIFPRKGSINFVFVFSGPSVEESCFHGTFIAGLKRARLCSSHIDIISLLCTCPFANSRLLLLREFSRSCVPQGCIIFLTVGRWYAPFFFIYIYILAFITLRKKYSYSPKVKQADKHIAIQKLMTK